MKGEQGIEKVWVVVSPAGLVWVGLSRNETKAWCIALGWPTHQEVDWYKERGWYAAEANITWVKPEDKQT